MVLCLEKLLRKLSTHTIHWIPHLPISSNGFWLLLIVFETNPRFYTLNLGVGQNFWSINWVFACIWIICIVSFLMIYSAVLILELLVRKSTWIQRDSWFLPLPPRLWGDWTIFLSLSWGDTWIFCDLGGDPTPSGDWLIWSEEYVEFHVIEQTKN